MVGTIQVDQLIFSFEDIRKEKYKLAELDSYYTDALNFCKDWLKGLASRSILTSGSTGPPKIISIERSQFEYSAQATVQALKLPEGCSSLICINTAYIGGLMMLIRGLEFDMDMHLLKPCANPLSGMIKSYDFIALVPLQLEAILNSSDSKTLYKSKAIIIGGAQINTSLRSKCNNISSPIYETYGMTETISHIALKRLNGSAASSNFDVIGDCQIASNENNCLTLQGSVSDHKKIETNDLVEIISSNSFRWLGRLDNVINSGGIKIEPEALEEQIAHILRPINRTFIITSKPDKKLGSKLILLIEGQPLSDTKQERILIEIKEKVEDFKAPKSIRFIPSLLRTPTDKIDRKANQKAIS